MSEAKHTPGPWEWYEAKNEHGEETIGIRGDGRFIATIDTMATGGGPYLMQPNGAADARLIAAAPDLLEALESALLDSGGGIAGPTHPDVCQDEGQPRWAGWARAAIARAKGR